MSATTAHPQTLAPPGAWDAHCHTFGPPSEFPYSETRTFTPEPASKAAMFAMHAALGLERAVIVQSGVHGFDNSAVADALRAKNGAYRGVALLPTDVGDSEIQSLSAAGFCGVRFNFMKHLGEASPISDIMRLAHRLADHNWHLQIHFDPSLLADMIPALRASPVPVVIDHMGRIDAGLGAGQPHFKQLLGLMEDQRFWMKLSGSERISRLGPPYRDAIPFARTFMSQFGDRVLWGTDWPHPNVAGPTPDDAALLDLVAAIAPTPAERQALLVDNPMRFYGGAS